jgi:ParB family chromosome partitioning protein
MAGAVVYIGHNGKAETERGLVRPEDMPKKSAKPKKANGAASPDVEQDDSPALSAALIESLTAHKSAALAAKLAETPNVALAAVVYALALDTFGHRGDTALKLSGSSQSLHRVEGSPAFQQMQAAREAWGQRIPGKPEDIWHWCLEQPVDVLLGLLAFCAASSVNAVQLKADRADGDRLQHAGQLAQAVGLDMKAWFTPDAGNYFSRVSKAQNLAAIAEAKGQPPAPAWEKLKKAELAKVAERETAGTGWLPEMLRA